LYDLESQHGKIRAHYEDEVARTRQLLREATHAAAQASGAVNPAGVGPDRDRVPGIAGLPSSSSSGQQPPPSSGGQPGTMGPGVSGSSSSNGMGLAGPGGLPGQPGGHQQTMGPGGLPGGAPSGMYSDPYYNRDGRERDRERERERVALERERMERERLSMSGGNMDRERDRGERERGMSISERDRMGGVDLRDRDRDGGRMERDRMDSMRDKERERDQRETKRLKAGGDREGPMGLGMSMRDRDPRDLGMRTDPRVERDRMPIKGSDRPDHFSPSLMPGQTPKLPPHPSASGSAAAAANANAASGSSGGAHGASGGYEGNTLGLVPANAAANNTNALVPSNANGSGNQSFPDDLDIHNVPPDMKKEGSDWFAVFNPNPKVKRVLDVSLVHTLMHERFVLIIKILFSY